MKPGFSKNALFLTAALFFLSSCLTLERRQLHPPSDRERASERTEQAEQDQEESSQHQADDLENAGTARDRMPSPLLIPSAVIIPEDAGIKTKAEQVDETTTQPTLSLQQRSRRILPLTGEARSQQVEVETYEASGVVLRVRLFDQNKPQAYRLAPGAGQLTITDDAGFRINLHDEAGEVRVRVRPGTSEIEIIQNELSYSSAIWNIQTEAGGMMRINHPELGWRYYRGSADLSVNNGRIRTINHIDLEDYVASVVGGEMNFSHMEALKVQAVISRTYALWNSTTSAGNGYDLSDYVMSQVYPGELIHTPQYRAATEATTGEVLTWSGNILLAVYHSTCGGRTSANEEVWSGNALPYLRGQNDNGSCSASPHYQWNFEIPKREFHSIFGVSGINGINVDSSGRVTSFRLTENGREVERPANDIRLRLNRSHGALALRSTFFGLDEDEDYYIFNGRGLGHGLGLCQWGALGLAETGWSYQDILRFYYNGADISHVNTLGETPFRLARF
ncbi:MAG: SpoIID/LytB domain-containing protein [Balneolia bacterium]|nr:SpoIID/LytB domain-containing protein [Balneolia bacterium]